MNIYHSDPLFFTFLSKHGTLYHICIKKDSILVKAISFNLFRKCKESLIFLKQSLKPKNNYL